MSARMAGRGSVLLVVVLVWTVMCVAETNALESMICQDRPTHSCVNYTSTDGFGPDRGCQCDASCKEYGDCCPDAPQVAPTPADTRYRCVSEVYMRDGCVDGWPDGDVRTKCEDGEPEDISSKRDPVAHLPVTSVTSNATYRNFYCALCNNDASNFTTWGMEVECPTLEQDSLVNNSLAFRGGQWSVSDGNDIHNCSIDLKRPILQDITVRECVPAMAECAEGWDDAGLRDLCRSYTSFVYLFGSLAFRNEHCAKCNNVSLDLLTCEKTITVMDFPAVFRFGPGIGSFTVLIDFSDLSGSNVVGSRCTDRQLWDPFSKTCRDAMCDAMTQQYVDGKCIDVSPMQNSTAVCVDRNNVEKVNGSSASVNCSESGVVAETLSNTTCVRVLLLMGEFEALDNDTLIVHHYNLTYGHGEYEVVEEGVIVCLPAATNAKYPAMMGIVTLVGLGVSSLCLTLHLVAFCLVPHLRNLAGKNLTSLALSLLLAYVAFIASVFGENETPGCYVLAVLIYYFFMASFWWMNIQGFDVFITFRLASTQLRVSSGHQWRRFFLYSAVGWIIPAIEVAGVVALDVISPPEFPEDYLPRFGQSTCWFGQRKALLVFFGVPLFSFIFVNLVLFVVTTRMLAAAKQSQIRSSSSGEAKKQLKLYVRLTILTGLSWVTATLGAYWEAEVAWYVFLVLNTLQGLFLFLAFTCRTRVWQDVSKRLRCCKSHKSSRKSRNAPTSSTNLPVTSNSIGASQASVDTTVTHL